MNKPSTPYVLALLAGLVAAGLSYFAPFFPYGEDSASYLDQARTLMARGVFEKTPYGLWAADVDYVTDKTFPPGYPLLIVLFSLLSQQPVEVVAPLLSLAALVAIPVAVVFAFQRFIGAVPALCIAVLVVFTPAAVRHGYIAFSDTLSLLWVIVSVKLALTADNKAKVWFALGLLTGFSYLLRNANLGLLLSIGGYLAWCFWGQPEQRKAILRNGLIWGAGNAVIMAPWLIRNFVMFGKFQPYWMPASKVGFIDNCKDYLKAQLDTLLSFSDIDALFADHLVGVLAVLLVLAVFAQQAITTWRQWQKTDQQLFVLAAVYAVLGAAIVIAARTKYEWGEFIHARYALPYACFVLVALYLVIKNSRLSAPNRTRLLLFMLSILSLGRLLQLPKLYEYNSLHQTVLSTAKQIKDHPDVVCSDLKGRFAVSNYGFVYRVLCGAPVRHGFPLFKNNRFINESLPAWLAQDTTRGVVVSLFPYVDDDDNALPLASAQLSKLAELGWQVELNQKDHVILSHPAKLAVQE